MALFECAILLWMSGQCPVATYALNLAVQGEFAGLGVDLERDHLQPVTLY